MFVDPFLCPFPNLAEFASWTAAAPSNTAVMRCADAPCKLVCGLAGARSVCNPARRNILRAALCEMPGKVYNSL